MAKNAAGTIIGVGAFVAASVCGIVITAYSIATAYIMGAEAQSHVDETVPADPMTLLRESMASMKAQLGINNEPDHSPIDMDDTSYIIIDAG